MKKFIAVLIKGEKTPKFLLIKDGLSEEDLDGMLSKFKIEKESIQATCDMGSNILDPLFLSSLENEDGNLKLVENYSEKVLDVRVRRNRDTLLEATDKQFMEALSRGDQTKTKMIADNKQYLRDITKNQLQDPSGRFYNFFFNITNLNIIDGGQGYDSPPKITISPPTCNEMDSITKMSLGSVGKQAEATCSIKNGVVYEINMKDWGCGYVDLPTINVSSPTSKNSRVAKLTPFIINILIPERK